MLRPTFGCLGGLRAFLGLLGRLIFEALCLLYSEVFFDVLKECFLQQWQQQEEHIILHLSEGCVVRLTS